MKRPKSVMVDRMCCQYSQVVKLDNLAAGHHTTKMDSSMTKVKLGSLNPTKPNIRTCLLG